MLGCGGDEVSIIAVVSPHGLISVSSIIFLLLVIIINLIVFYFLSLLYNKIFNSISIRRDVGREKSSSHSRRRSGVSSGGIK